MEANKQAYQEIFELLETHKNLHVFDINELQSQSNIHLFWLELTKIYKLNIPQYLIMSLGWNRITEYISIAKWGTVYNRTLGYSDTKIQPHDETLMCIQFSSGAYMFGDDYPKQLFVDMFNELKTYNPKYSDSRNYTLLFELNNAANVYNEFDNILKKYYKRYDENSIENKINIMEQELIRLKNERNHI